MAKCKICKRESEYKPWICYHCAKKEDFVKDGIIDIFDCLYWCDARVHGIRDRVWDKMTDTMQISKETLIRFSFEAWLNAEDEDYRYIAKEFSGLGVKLLEFDW